MTDRCQCTNCDHLLVEKFKQQRDEALKRIEDFKRHVIPCVICEYEGGVLITRCWLHEKLEEERQSSKVLVDGMKEIMERKNQVCPQYEICSHPVCDSSYEAFVIAEKSLEAYKR